MPDSVSASLPSPTPEPRRQAAASFDRANQWITAGQWSPALALLLLCCRLDPANLIYRQALRGAQKARYRHHPPGARFGRLRTLLARVRFRAAWKAGDWVKVLEWGEDILLLCPWDPGVQWHMAQAAAALGQEDLAIWILEEARLQCPEDETLNQALATLYEKAGRFSQAFLLREKRPSAASDPSSLPGAAALAARIRADPTNPQGYWQLARLYRQARRLDQAREILLQGMGPTGQAFALVLELAELDLDPLRHDLVLTEEKLLGQATDPDLLHIRARLLREINNRELELYRLRADRFPADREARLELAIRLLRAQRLEEGLEELQILRKKKNF
jgi:thioredoxin-like negative regulator of GroEL